MGREWIKLYCDKWLDGSMSWELTDAQVGIWSKILALAGRYYREGKYEGFIPLSKEAICHAVTRRRNNFDKAWDILIKTDRIKLTDDGVLVTNFKTLNPTRQQVYEEKHPEARLRRLDETPTPSDKSLQKPTPTHRERETERDRDIYTSSSKWYQGFRKDYPTFKDSDLAAAYEWIAEWNEGHPRAKPRSVTKRFLINWAKKKEEGSGRDKRDPKTTGRVPEIYTPADEL